MRSAELSPELLTHLSVHGRAKYLPHRAFLACGLRLERGPDTPAKLHSEVERRALLVKALMLKLVDVNAIGVTKFGLQSRKLSTYPVQAMLELHVSVALSATLLNCWINTCCASESSTGCRSWFW